MSSSSHITRIFIVDDHPVVLDGYAMLLGAEVDFELCGSASNEMDALKQIKEVCPDLAIVDLMLEGSFGIELIQQLKLQMPSMKVLVVSASDEKLFAARALRAGALGYLNKREASQCLVDAIRKVLSNEVVLSDEMTKRLLRSQIGGKSPENSDSPVEVLSDRELHVFQLIGQGMATRVIAERLFLSPRTVERYRENIKAKLNLSNAIELVQFATRWSIENER